LGFEIIGEIEAIQTIATGAGVKVRSLLRKMYGRGLDYLFSRGQFAFVEFPQAVRRKILALQRASRAPLNPDL